MNAPISVYVIAWPYALIAPCDCARAWPQPRIPGTHALSCAGLPTRHTAAPCCYTVASGVHAPLCPTQAGTQRYKDAFFAEDEREDVAPDPGEDVDVGEPEGSDDWRYDQRREAR